MPDEDKNSESNILEPNATYEIYTPYGNEEAAQILYEELQKSKFLEHKQIVLTNNLPEHDLKAGDVGVIVHIYPNAVAYEVEFFTLDGHTVDVITVEANQIRAVNPRDVLHARERSAS